VSNIKIILKELFSNLQLIWTVARYNNKASFQGHYFGVVWEFLNPLIQIAIWGFVFGAIRNRSDVNVGTNAIPFIPWMLVGMTVWLFMNRATTSGALSVQRQIKLVAKMQFPVSILPAMDIAAKLTSYLFLLLITVIIILLNGIMPTLHWLSFFYYFVAMLIFIYFFALLNSTITLLFRDYHNILKPVMRLFFFFSGPIWRMQEMSVIPNWFVRLMDLTPFSYIITGLRQSFFGEGFARNGWGIATLSFWLIVTLIALVGSHMHLKLKSKFVDLA